MSYTNVEGYDKGTRFNAPCLLCVWNPVASVLEEFLFADGGDEFFEVEWFEVGYVFEVAFAVGFEGWLEHCGCVRVALAEVGVRVLDHVCTFAGSVADEEDRTLLEVFCEAGFVNDGWGGFGQLDVGGRSACNW